MARENTVYLVGKVTGAPVVNLDKQKGKITMQTFRRNEKVDDITVSVHNAILCRKLQECRENDFIIVKGMLVTGEGKKASLCPHCNSRNAIEGMTTSVIALCVDNMGPNHSLAELKEISNTIHILGSLCKDPEFSVLNGGTPTCKFQMAVNRKYNLQANSDARADFPWVSSFGKDAEDNIKRLTSGSQVYIQGGLQTRLVPKEIKCSECHETYTANDTVMDIVTYFTEYLDKCKF